MRYYKIFRTRSSIFVIVMFLALSLDSCMSFYLVDFHRDNGLEYERKNAYRNEFEDAYKLVKKYGNCFVVSDYIFRSGYNYVWYYDYYWSYFTKDGKCYIYTLNVLKEDRNIRAENIVEYNKDMNWVWSYEHISFWNFTFQNKINFFNMCFYLFLKTDGGIIAYRPPITVKLAKEEKPDGKWGYDYIDNILEDLDDYPIVPEYVLGNYWF